MGKREEHAKFRLEDEPPGSQEIKKEHNNNGVSQTTWTWQPLHVIVITTIWCLFVQN